MIYAKDIVKEFDIPYWQACFILPFLWIIYFIAVPVCVLIVVYDYLVKK